MSFHPTTPRLILRAPMLSDGSDVVKILNEFDVVKNLAMVPFPFTEELYRARIVVDDQERHAGDARRFAVTRGMDGAFIGMCAIERLGNNEWDFGYWFGKSYWGQGYATEAAQPVLRLAFDDMGAERLTAGWFDDNPASGAVLHKLGFSITGVMPVRCVSRGCEVLSNRVELTRGEFARKKAA